MKGYKKLMDIVAMVEKTVLVVTMILILVLTVGNVFSRKVIHQSWSFTEELVVAIFVLITLLGAALSAREGGLVGLNLVTERLPKSAKKPVMILITIFSVLFMGILFYYGMDKVLAQLANQKRTFVLNWPEWIFWSFVPIGSGCMILHFKPIKDIDIKKYLEENELEVLNNLVSGYFDLAEINAIEHKPMYMDDYVKQLDSVLSSGNRKLLTGVGSVSHKQVLEKAKSEYRKYQEITLTPVEKAYLESIKEVSKEVKSR